MGRDHDDGTGSATAWPGGGHGASQVEQFRTAAAASGELAFLDGQVKQPSLGPGRYRSFVCVLA